MNTKIFVLTFLMVSAISFGRGSLKEKTVVRCPVTLKLYDTDPIGIWKYFVEGVGPEYEEGILFVRKENGKYKIEIQLSSGALTGQDVQIQEDNIKFNMNIEGVERISVVLQVKGNTLLGEAYSGQRTYKVKGKRKLPPE
ncbi:hypothetical protein [Maribacter sp. 2304DJ31-5]|uniref:hypothetical protein n=1 Tax=Maribacter sp. 2304DJ31-5 TaxID=3386273 RepID=UPI0039BCDD9E